MKEIQEYFDSLISERADRSRQTGVYQFYLMPSPERARDIEDLRT